MKKDIAMLAGVSRPTVDFWIDRYGFGGVAALHDRPSGAPREQIPPTVRGRIFLASSSVTSVLANARLIDEDADTLREVIHVSEDSVLFLSGLLHAERVRCGHP